MDRSQYFIKKIKKEKNFDYNPFEGKLEDYYDNYEVEDEEEEEDDDENSEMEGSYLEE